MVFIESKSAGEQSVASPPESHKVRSSVVVARRSSPDRDLQIKAINMTNAARIQPYAINESNSPSEKVCWETEQPDASTGGFASGTTLQPLVNQLIA